MQQLAKDYMTATQATVRHALAHARGSDEYCDQVECYMLDKDGELMLGQDDLAVDVLRDEDGDVAHLRVTWALGGPNVFLIRDWGGDRLVVNWDTRETWYDEDVTDLLDAYVEMFTY